MIPDTHNQKKTFGELMSDHGKSIANSHELYEAGEIGFEMGKQYMKDLISMIKKHKNLKGEFYILALQSQNAITPSAQYVTFCSMRNRPKPHLSTDLWKFSNETCNLELIWTLPSWEMWDSVWLNPHTDPFLKTCMHNYLFGKLDPKPEKIA